MPRYYFDVRDGDALLPDPEGTDLAGIEAAQEEATSTVTELARSVLRGVTRRVLTVEVRNEAREPVLRTQLSFEIERLR